MGSAIRGTNRRHDLYPRAISQAKTIAIKNGLVIIEDGDSNLFCRHLAPFSGPLKSSKICTLFQAFYQNQYKCLCQSDRRPLCTCISKHTMFLELFLQLCRGTHCIKVGKKGTIKILQFGGFLLCIFLVSMEGIEYHPPCEDPQQKSSTKEDSL